MAIKPRKQVPAVTTDQMREVDRIMVEDLHIELVQMMENAGRTLAELAVSRFSPATVVILCGPGGNGGGGMVAARHLANRGRTVSVVLSEPDHLTPVPAHQTDILNRMRVPIINAPVGADLVLDALIGYSLHGDPSGRAAALIDWANDQPAPILSLDAPSGVDATTGVVGKPSIRATATLALALPKVGLIGGPSVGELYVADISVPPHVYQRFGINPRSFFDDAGLIRVAP